MEGLGAGLLPTGVAFDHVQSNRLEFRDKFFDPSSLVEEGLILLELVLAQAAMDRLTFHTACPLDVGAVLLLV